MSKQELIKQCRYYKGEDKCPFEDGDMSWFWDMERVYVSSSGKFVGETAYYKTLKGKTYPGIPFALLMVMFTSWGKWTTGIKEHIKDFYNLVDEYLFIPNDYLPEDKIPNQ